MTATRSLQGDRDGLCGLYAVVNATVFLFQREMTEAHKDELFRRVALALDVWPAALWEGTDAAQMATMLIAAQEFTQRRLNSHLTWHRMYDRKRPRSAKHFISNLDTRLSTETAASIILLHSPAPHWTVCTKITPKHLTLADSSDFQHMARIPRSKLDLPDTAAQWVVDPRSSFVINRIR